MPHQIEVTDTVFEPRRVVRPRLAAVLRAVV